MALKTNQLKLDLAAAIKAQKPTIQAALLTSLSNPLPKHTAVGVDEADKKGGVVESEATNSIFTVHEKIDKWCIENPPEYKDNTPEERAEYKNRVWEQMALFWSTALAEHVAKDLTNVLAAGLAPLMAEIMETYIKSADIFITVPPGTVTIGAGVTAIPNPVPIQLVGSPVFDVPTALQSATLKVTNFGGIK